MAASSTFSTPRRRSCAVTWLSGARTFIVIGASLLTKKTQQKLKRNRSGKNISRTFYTGVLAARGIAKYRKLVHAAFMIGSRMIQTLS